MLTDVIALVLLWHLLTLMITSLFCSIARGPLWESPDPNVMFNPKWWYREYRFTKFGAGLILLVFIIMFPGWALLYYLWCLLKLVMIRK